MRKEQEKQDIWLWSELTLIQIAHQPTNLLKTTNFPTVLYKIDRKVLKLTFKFAELILLSDCKWELDAPKQNAAVRPWCPPMCSNWLSLEPKQNVKVNGQFINFTRLLGSLANGKADVVMHHISPGMTRYNSLKKDSYVLSTPFMARGFKAAMFTEPTKIDLYLFISPFQPCAWIAILSLMILFRWTWDRMVYYMICRHGLWWENRKILALKIVLFT